MAQPKPDRTSIEEILRLVDELSEEEQDQLGEELKLKWLRRALDEGEESIRQHGTLPAEEVFAELKERYERKKASQ